MMMVFAIWLCILRFLYLFVSLIYILHAFVFVERMENIIQTFSENHKLFLVKQAEKVELRE